MASHKADKSAILYQNASKTVTLLDLPKSIELAQEVAGARNGNTCPNVGEMYSAAPPKSPYPSTEPKSAKLRAAWQTSQNPFSSELLQQALTSIASGCNEFKDRTSGAWCLPRHVGDAQERDRKTVMERQLSESLNKIHAWSAEAPKALPPERILRLNLTQVVNRLVCNKHLSSARLSLEESGTEYHIPPLSRYLLSKITPATVMSFSMAALQEYPAPSTTTPAGAGEFDLIILDPPWPNRSVRRSRHYLTMKPEENPLSALSSIMTQHIAPGALVACWITNKVTVREEALDLFAHWDLEVVEEWAWLKVTIEGEPVTGMEGVWRKPYELLLIGKRFGVKKPTSVAPGGNQNEIVRKVLVAVPSLHSQKPHLGELIKQILPNTITNYRTLEIFARNLTAGWWAWGNDVLKFNDIQAWHTTQSTVELNG